MRAPEMKLRRRIRWSNKMVNGTNLLFRDARPKQSPVVRVLFLRDLPASLLKGSPPAALALISLSCPCGLGRPGDGGNGRRRRQLPLRGDQMVSRFNRLQRRCSLYQHEDPHTC